MEGGVEMRGVVLGKMKGQEFRKMKGAEWRTRVCREIRDVG